MTGQLNNNNKIYTRVHSWCCTFYRFEQMCKDTYPLLQYDTESFHYPKNLLDSACSAPCAVVMDALCPAPWGQQGHLCPEGHRRTGLERSLMAGVPGCQGSTAGAWPGCREGGSGARLGLIGPACPALWPSGEAGASTASAGGRRDRWREAGPSLPAPGPTWGPSPSMKLQAATCGVHCPRGHTLPEMKWACRDRGGTWG